MHELRARIIGVALRRVQDPSFQLANFDRMASPHASSFICLPFSDHSDMVTAYTVYFGVCMGSALFGVFGAVIFLIQVLRSTTDAYPGKATSQRWILIMLAVSDLFADLGKVQWRRGCTLALAAYT